jgi:hypothetical protein
MPYLIFFVIDDSHGGLGLVWFPCRLPCWSFREVLFAEVPWVLCNLAAGALNVISLEIGRIDHFDGT